MPDDTEDWESPADPAFIRQVILDVLPEETLLETATFARPARGRRAHRPQRGPRRHVHVEQVPWCVTVGAHAYKAAEVIANSVNWSAEFDHWIRHEVPFGHRLLTLLERHDALLAARYTAYLRALHRQPPTAHGIPAAAMAVLAADWGISPSSVRRVVVRAEQYLVEQVHALHMRQLAALLVRLETAADESWTEA